MAVVLFVDDEPDTLKTLQKAVGMFGHQALLARSGQEAFLRLKETRPDLIFVDMQLADTDGLTVIRQFKRNVDTASTPVVVLSAGAELDCAKRAAAAGAQGFVCKPIRLQDLLEIINQYLNGEPQGSAA